MKYIGWVMGESRKAVGPLGQQLAVGEGTRFPERAISLCLRKTSLAQGWRMGFLRSATRWVGCLPVTRNSSFDTYGWAGSCTTGPGPLAGGMKRRLYASRAGPECSAKLGGAARCAAAETFTLPARETAPARTPSMNFPAW